LSFIDPAIVLSIFIVSFIDPAIDSTITGSMNDNINNGQYNSRVIEWQYKYGEYNSRVNE
jgi:hypothetical protein